MVRSDDLSASATSGVVPYYEDDATVIYHGDCLEILPLLADAFVTITDPPYGVGLTYGAEYTDEAEGYAAWVAEMFPIIRSASKRVLITPGIRNIWLYPKADWVFCWSKANSMRRSDLGGFNQWEPILVYGKKVIYQDLFVVPTVPSKQAFGHPCPKPLKLMSWLATKASDPGDTILDPFMGSGTTLRAAKDLGRKAVGIDIEERYCEIAANRLAQEVLAL